MSGVFQNKILTPTPSYLPSFGAGEGYTRWMESGWGVNILEDARHCSVLYIREYFVTEGDRPPYVTSKRRSSYCITR